MGDRIPYVAGNTQGRDHINWPTILRSQIDSVNPGMSDGEKDRTWPVDITLAQIMALVWRVKRWALTGSIEASIIYNDGGGFQIITATGTSEFESSVFGHPKSDSSLTTRELDLVQRVGDSPYEVLSNYGISSAFGASPIANWEVNGNNSISGGGPGPFSESGSTPASDPNSVQIQLLGALFGFHLFDEDAGLFSPPMSAAASLIRGTLQAGFEFNRNPQTVLAGIGPVVLQAPGTFTVDPVIAPAFDIPIEIQWRLAGEAIGSVISGTGTGELSLTATEFYEYAGSDNGPIYDSSNGDLLPGRTPLS